MTVVGYTKAKIDSLLSRKVSIDDITKPATESGLALASIFTPRGERPLSALAYGADPTGATDSTAAFQAAVDAAISTGNGSLYIPAGTYKVLGTVTAASPITISGDYAPRTSTTSQFTRTGGTVIVAGPGTAGAPVFDLGGNASTNGLRLVDLLFLGSTHFNTYANAVDRVAVRVRKVHTEVSFERVTIVGFLRQALLLDEVFDGHLIGCRILNSGTDGTYPAIDYTGTAANTNALHAFGLHVEGNPFALRISGASRHNQFVACKFEMYTPNPVTSPIQILDSYETTFTDCQFVARNTDDTYFYPLVTTQPHMILINDPKAVVKISGGLFSSPNYQGGTPTALQGTRWVKKLAGKVSIIGSDFNVCWAGNGEKAIVLGDNDLFIGNTVASRSKTGQRNLMQVGARCTVTGNVIQMLDDTATVTTGALFTCIGTRNTFDNQIIGNYAAALAGPSPQNYRQLDDSAGLINVQVFTSDGTWVKPVGANIVTVELMAGAGGGGSGRRGAAGTVRCGGGGGGGAGKSRRTFPASILPATVAVGVGTPGVGGAAVTVDDTNGNSGTAGGNSVFGTYLRATAGSSGSGGTAATGLGGSGGVGTEAGGSGAAASTTGGTGAAPTATAGAAGGGSGGGITSANVASSGGNGGANSTANNTAAAAGIVDSTPPAAGASQPNSAPIGGNGGAGGAASITASAQAGAAAGLYSAGGGGGGASVNGFASGRGGDGTPGLVVVISQ